MLNNFFETNNESEEFVSHGKVVTNKDGIFEIVGLGGVAVREVVNIGHDYVGPVTLIKTVRGAWGSLRQHSSSKVLHGGIVIPSGSLFCAQVGSNILVERAAGLLGNSIDGLIKFRTNNDAT